MIGEEQARPGCGWRICGMRRLFWVSDTITYQPTVATLHPQQNLFRAQYAVICVLCSTGVIVAILQLQGEHQLSVPRCTRQVDHWCLYSTHSSKDFVSISTAITNDYVIKPYVGWRKIDPVEITKPIFLKECLSDCQSVLVQHRSAICIAHWLPNLLDNFRERWI
jgi:hypothetical protein